MKRYKINGGYYLNGDVFVSGSKNASLPIICASAMLKGKVELTNVPDISDVNVLIEMLRDYNVKIVREKDKLIIDSSDIHNVDGCNINAKNFRASYYLLGSLINVFDDVSLYKQGGCKLGDRPIDLHSFAFSRLGLKLCADDEKYRLIRCGKGEKRIEFKKVSMGATINAIMASLSTKNKVIIKNISLEPEVVDLVNFLNACGYVVELHKNSVVVHKERKNNEFVKYKIMYDRIEAGSYAILSALVGNGVHIHNFNGEHLRSLLLEFDKLGVFYRLSDDVLYVGKRRIINPVKIVADVYPKFPTDLMQMMSVLLLVSGDISVFKDCIYPKRYAQLLELSKYGVDIDFDGDEVLVYGNSYFSPGVFVGSDLRGTMALVMYALNCDGESYVYGIEYLERGYSDIVNKLINIGACIEVETVEE